MKKDWQFSKEYKEASIAEKQMLDALSDILYEVIEAACDGPYLEMFARRRRHGWDVWGNEAPLEYYPLQEKMV